MNQALDLLRIALPVWFVGVFLFQPIIAAGLGYAAGLAGATIDPERGTYFGQPPHRLYRAQSLGRREADLAYLKKMLDEQLEELEPIDRQRAKDYLQSLGYERVSL